MRLVFRNLTELDKVAEESIRQGMHPEEAEFIARQRAALLAGFKMGDDIG